jgi:transcriptional regulator with XRE-family HTH domain
MKPYSPTVRLRRLARELAALRKAAELTPAEAARLLGWSQSRISRYEGANFRNMDARDVREMAALYGLADRDRVEALVELAIQGRERRWWSSYRDVFRGRLPDFEAGARCYRNYETMFVPGLLQTPAYMEAVFRGAHVLNEETGRIKRRVEARLARQEILRREPPASLSFVIEETVLTRPVGGWDTMQEQIAHLRQMAERPNVEIQVLLASVGAHLGMNGPFIILDFAPDDEPSLVYQETLTHSDFLDEPEDVRRYVDFYGHLRGLAMSPMESASHLDRSLRALEDRLSDE